MKNLIFNLNKYILILISFLFISSGIYSQNTSVQNEIIDGVRISSAEKILKSVEDKVFISIMNKSANASKSQATVILKDFFKSNRVKSLEYKSNELSGGITLIKGKLTSSDNKVYSISININKSKIIQEIIISNE